MLLTSYKMSQNIQMQKWVTEIYNVHATLFKIEDQVFENV